MADPVRVLELVVATDLGGGPSHVRDLLAALPREEFVVTVAGPRRAGAPTAIAAPVVPVAADRLSPRVLAQVIRLIREREIDVVHSHGKGAGFYGRMAARRVGVAAVHTFHGIHYAHYPPGVRGAYLAVERRLARWTHTVIHVSASQAEEAARLGLAPAGRTRVIVNGIDAVRVQALAAASPIGRRALGVPAAVPVVGTVSRLDPVKRLDVLLDAFARVRRGRPDAILLVVGDGPGGARLRRRARDLGIAPATVWAGAIADAARVLAAVDVFVSASRREGLPLAMLEAMAVGLPVVATRVPGHVDVVEEGTTGLLVDPDDPAALAAAIGTVLADPARARALGAAGRARVERAFSARRMAGETAECYRDAAARFHRGRERGGGV